MLEPNAIPTSEPTIRVGIVLPVDHEKRIELRIPQQPGYVLQDDAGRRTALQAGDLLQFGIGGTSITSKINDSQPETAVCWFVQPTGDFQIDHKTGVLAQKIISGRGFHWSKHIEVFLPGKLEIGRIDNDLILINELPIEQYLMCVATSEMGAACPPALIESQTIVARSWMLANVEMKHRSIGMDVCNDDCCQRYQGTTHLTRQSIQGALITSGQVLLYGGKICDARYSKSCGGVMESFENVWEGGKLDYLQPIPDAVDGFRHPSLPLNSEENVRVWIADTPQSFCSSLTVPENELKKYLGSVDEEGHYFRWQFRYTQEQLTNLLNRKCALAARAIKSIEPVRRGDSGRLIEVGIRYLNQSGDEQFHVIKDQHVIRHSFHETFLYSSAFVVDIETGESDIPLAFLLKGGGWGHGVGYCQIGALGMALSGYSAEEIVLHYLPGSRLVKIY